MILFEKLLPVTRGSAGPGPTAIPEPGQAAVSQARRAEPHTLHVRGRRHGLPVSSKPRHANRTPLYTLIQVNNFLHFQFSHLCIY